MCFGQVWGAACEIDWEVAEFIGDGCRFVTAVERLNDDDRIIRIQFCLSGFILVIFG